MDDLQELLVIFRSETAEQLDELGALLDLIIDCPDDELLVLLRAILRIAHSIKGSACSVGEMGMSEAAHELEDVLIPYREKKQRVSVSVQEQCLHILERMRHFSRTIEETSEEGDYSGDGAGHVASIRVDMAHLDDLMMRTHELSIWQSRNESRLQQWKVFYRGFDKLINGSQPSSEEVLEQRDALRGLIQRERTEIRQFGYVAADINQSIKQIRMQRLERLVPFWRRTVQQSAQYLERRVLFNAEVGQIRIDRYMVEHLQDSLLHILRNAVDHGIESPEIRRERGKDTRGRIEVRAGQIGGMISIEVSDDGGGINLKAVKTAAIKRGTVSREQADLMDDVALMNLLFDSTFSTSDHVSQISGRGVGLGVVRQNVMELGGRVEVAPEARLGGTTFYLTLPVSMLSTMGLLVSAEEVVYAVPTDDIEQVVHLSSEQIQRSQGDTVATLSDGTVVPLVGLAQLMGGSTFDISSQQQALIISRETSRLGLAVDKIMSEREYLVEQLPWNLEQINGVNGTIVLPDGALAVSLDAAQILAMPRNGPTKKITPTHASVPRILVVDDSMTSRVLERNFLAGAGYQVETAEDGEAGWALLQKKAFNLVVSDVEMPRLTGLDLTRRIRASEKFATLPIILITQLASKEDVANGKKAGADDYLIKGQFDQKSLLNAVSRLL